MTIAAWVLIVLDVIIIGLGCYVIIEALMLQHDLRYHFKGRPVPHRPRWYCRGPKGVTATVFSPAPEGSRFVASAFEKQVGKDIPVMSDRGVGTAKLVAAEVSTDGSGVSLTFEFDPESEPWLSGGTIEVPMPPPGG